MPKKAKSQCVCSICGEPITTWNQVGDKKYCGACYLKLPAEQQDGELRIRLRIPEEVEDDMPRKEIFG